MAGKEADGSNLVDGFAMGGLLGGYSSSQWAIYFSVHCSLVVRHGPSIPLHPLASVLILALSAVAPADVSECSICGRYPDAPKGPQMSTMTTIYKNEV